MIIDFSALFYICQIEAFHERHDNLSHCQSQQLFFE